MRFWKSDDGFLTYASNDVPETGYHEITAEEAAPVLGDWVLPPQIQQQSGPTLETLTEAFVTLITDL